MYCPKCGTQNIAEAKFCRLCGIAFQGFLQPAQAVPVLPDYGRVFRPLFGGIGFLVIVLISIFSHTGFFWWMLFPALSLLSRGVKRLHKLKSASLENVLPQQPRMFDHQPPQPVPPAIYSNDRARPTGELIAPPSVTENTTRLLDKE